jgi:hypothetical protein
VRLTISSWIGSLLNWLQLPGVVREGNYTASCADVSVTVRCSSLYSVVSVNGVDVYFHRVTGVIDGVGITRAAHYKAGGIRESGRLDEQLERLLPEIQSRTLSGCAD